MINHCLYPVAGFGTRFLPVTKTVAKELLPILDKPLLQYAIEESYNCGILNHHFIVNKYKKAIQDYLSPHPYLDNLILGTPKEQKLLKINEIIKKCNFTFFDQAQMLGLGHAILQSEEGLKTNSFAVVLPDDLCFNKGKSVIQQLIDVSNTNPDKCIVAVEEVGMQEVSKYGVIDGFIDSENKNIIKVSKMVEKPNIEEAPSNLAIIGRYVLTPEIFGHLKKVKPDRNGEIQITDALKELAKKEKVIAIKFEGKRIDCGSVKGFIEANNYFLSQSKENS